jgi:hypothetical protein
MYAFLYGLKRRWAMWSLGNCLARNLKLIFRFMEFWRIGVLVLWNCGLMLGGMG